MHLKDFVDADLYKDEEAVLQDALRHLLRNRPDLRIRLAIHQYEHGGVSLAKAAELAGVSWPHMRDILQERSIDLRLGSMSIEEAESEVEQLRHHLTS